MVLISVSNVAKKNQFHHLILVLVPTEKKGYQLKSESQAFELEPLDLQLISRRKERGR
jgi:hypothetical protein